MMTKKIRRALLYKDASKIKKLIRQGYHLSHNDLSEIDLTSVFHLKNDVILTIIKYNKNINIQNKNKDIPLFLAIAKNDEKIVEELLKYGADVNYEVDGLPYRTAMQTAFLIKYNLKIIKLLIEYGADLKENNIGWIAFKKAILDNDKEVYELLIDCQIHMGTIMDMSPSLLFYAVNDNNYKLLKKIILEYKISDVNYSHFKWGKRLLPIATSRKSYKIIKLLIENGIDINQEFSDGVNSLMFAVNYMLDEKKSVDNQKIIKLLIDSKIDINKETDKGFTALMIACKDKNSIDNIEILLNSGAEINHQNKNGLTALICSVKERNFEITKLLIDRGADINISNNQGVTPLMLASWQNDIDTIKLLNTANIDIDLKDDDEYVAFDYMSINFGQKYGVLDIFKQKDKYQNIKDKISKIDTNHGIDKEKFKNWIEQSSMVHKPNELVKVLRKFSSSEQLKYTNHPWDIDLDYKKFIEDLNNGWQQEADDLKKIAPSLYEDIEKFLFSKEENLSWSSSIIQKDIEDNNLNSQNIKELQEKIKSLIVVKQNDKNLKLLKKFTRIRKELKQEGKLEIKLDLDDLKEDKIDKFFTDIQRLEQALKLILSDINENAKKDTQQVVIKANVTDEKNIIELKIIHVNSTAPITADRLTETINKNGGNFKSIYDCLVSICDWSIDTVCSDSNRYKIDYLYPQMDNSEPHCTKIDKIPRGFTHILRFYI